MHTFQIRAGNAVVIDGQPYSPGTLKIYFEDPVIIVNDTMGRQNTVVKASYDQIQKVGTDHVGTPFGSFAELKAFALENFFSDAPVTGGVSSSSVTVGTYADMIAKASGSTAISFLVSADESKGMQNTTYQYYPTPVPVLMWLASTKEEI
jgi:hypothetical protein